ncbi:hypothetical protein T552_03323 [Pneumocystis carinii B80]|uniref:Polynucleotide adenylyltransferase n=1 Tax=Pneumocystis carinii (strain B80) TaxID=1408658 RepID=A0A0W4ZBB4_PNEC8|nr:hypothetical protein T552_03323 [Pneumocystis carinii B80]KTW25711.1 hypothetical protein T552_03323 [Pneumocystis carinii B80]
MNINNTLALENTRMIKIYVEIDPRVRPLPMIIKYWTKKKIINDTARGCILSLYTWICMIINFLQMRKSPILPSLHQLPREQNESTLIEGIDVSFFDDIDTFKGFGEKNTESGEEPFNTKRNLGNTANDTTMKGLQIEFCREFHLIASHCDLKEIYADYIFTHKKNIYKINTYSPPVYC